MPASFAATGRAIDKKRQEVSDRDFSSRYGENGIASLVAADFEEVDEIDQMPLLM